MTQEIRPLPTTPPDSYSDIEEASSVLREQLSARQADRKLIEAKSIELNELRRCDGERFKYIERLEYRIVQLARRPKL